MRATRSDTAIQRLPPQIIMAIPSPAIHRTITIIQMSPPLISLTQITFRSAHSANNILSPRRFLYPPTYRGGGMLFLPEFE